MDECYQPFLQEIRAQFDPMIEQLSAWANQNSGSDSVPHLLDMLALLEKDFAVLGGKQERIPLAPRKLLDRQGNLVEQPTAPALRITKRPEAPMRLFFGGHYDTVFSPASPFQRVERIKENVLQGPGVADMKGGLLIMLKALQVFEKTPWALNIGWEIVLNPDEEVGSASSEFLFKEGAKRAHYGLVFEPSFPDGSLVSARKGSINFALVVRGRASHVGRDFFSGINAIAALARLVAQLDALNDESSGLIVNAGHIEGGGPLNIVPDLAIGKVNIRVADVNQENTVMQTIAALIQEEKKKEGISIQFVKLAEREPKPFTKETEELFQQIARCAQELAFPLSWKPTGGVCDGNILAAAGLPTIDTLGAVGGNIHTPDEYVLLDQLIERTCLTSLFLMQLARRI